MLLYFWLHTVCERVCLRAAVVVVDWRQRRNCQFTAGQFISLDHRVLPPSIYPSFALYICLSYITDVLCPSLPVLLPAGVRSNGRKTWLTLKCRDGNKGCSAIHILTVSPVEQCWSKITSVSVNFRSNFLFFVYHLHPHSVSVVYLAINHLFLLFLWRHPLIGKVKKKKLKKKDYNLFPLTAC